MATQSHATQSRNGTDTPYVSHLLPVSSIVLDIWGSDDQAIAALLHDAGEDQGGNDTLDRKRDHFGLLVEDIVDQCTTNVQVPTSNPSQSGNSEKNNTSSTRMKNRLTELCEFFTPATGT